MTPLKRHVLVVASQCSGADHLVGLEETARELHGLLVDPEVGGCVDRREASLLTGRALGRDRILNTVAAAARAAEADEAVLVLAFLGHGEAPTGGGAGYTATGSQGGAPIDRVDLPALLGAVANHPRLRGVIVLLDICHAAAGSPELQSLVRGDRQGDLQIEVVHASAAEENAWDFALTRALMSILRSGLDDAGPTIRVDGNLKKQLSERVTGQLPVVNAYWGGDQTPEDMWLAHNRRSPRWPEHGTWGEVGQAAVHRACRELEGRPDPRWLTSADLRALAETSPEGSTGRQHAARVRLQEVLHVLEESDRVLAMVHAGLPGALTQEQVLQAAALARFPNDVLWREPLLTLRDAVEHALLNADAIGGLPQSLARLLAAFAHGAGRTEIPATWLGWLQEHRVSETATSWLANLGSGGPKTGARLVLGLLADGAEDVTRVEAWLLYGGAEIDRFSRPCAPGRSELPSALGEVVTWAQRRTNALGQSLKRVDVAAPTILLLDKPPEEHTVGFKHLRLGAQFEVVPRWSGLLDPPQGLGGAALPALIDAGQRLLDSNEDPAGGKPAWLADAHLESLETIADMLGRWGRGDVAWGVSRLPGPQWTLIAQELLEHTPALVWPHDNNACEGEELRAAVDEHWLELPQQLSAAYRRRLRAGLGGAPPEPLHNVRVAWHDEEWQAFCRTRAHRFVEAPGTLTLTQHREPE